MTGKLTEIKKIIKDVYKKQISGGELERFAAMIDYDIFERKLSLEHIYETAYSMELEIGASSSQAWWLFDCLLLLLDDCEDTAKRLYDCFMNCYDDYNLFYKLIAFNEQYLTKKEADAAKKKASGLFVKELLRGLV